MLLNFLILSLLAVSGVLGFDCQQTPDSQIFNGNTVTIPGGDPQPIPPRYNCTYLIQVPSNATDGLYARVQLWNGLKGQNDYILVTEMTTHQTTVNNQTMLPNNTWTMFLIPGASMTIQVVTKSVLMNSMFSITVDYYAVKIRPTLSLKTGGEMNFVDVATLRDNSSLFSCVTYTAGERVIANLLNAGFDNMANCYIVDGALDSINNIWSLGYVSPFSGSPIQTYSNFLTIVTFSDDSFQFVLNPASEAEPFKHLSASSVPASKTFSQFNNDAQEYLNFNGTGIVMDDLKIMSNNCTAVVVSGPPNNYSQVLLDLSTNPPMPHFFNLQYFTVISNNCGFSISTRLP